MVYASLSRESFTVPVRPASILKSHFDAMIGMSEVHFCACNKHALKVHFHSAYHRKACRMTTSPELP